MKCYKDSSFCSRNMKKGSRDHCTVEPRHTGTMCRRQWLDLGLLPLAVGLVMFLAVLICYTIAVLENHFDPLLPSISDTGIKKPEVYIFSQLINLASALAVVTIMLRYKILMTKVDVENVRLRRAGMVGCGTGLMGAVGLTLVANFPDDQAAAVHYTGAGLVFGMGTLYQVFDSIISFKMHPSHYSKRTVIARTLLAGISTAALFTSVCASVVFRLQGGKEYNKEDVLHWKPGQRGHATYLVANFAEWVLAFAFNCYFFTYICEFQEYTSQLNVKKLFCRSEQGAQSTQEQVRTPDLETSGRRDQSQTYAQPNERTALLRSDSHPTYV